MQMSNDIKDLAAALSAAQGEIRCAAKDRKNPHIGNTYADLASVWEACRAPLSRHGLAVTQCAGQVENGILTMTTILMHSSGQYVSSSMCIPAGRRATHKEKASDPAVDTVLDAQSLGSAITYARRYSLAAIVGIAADDDDGNAASATKEDRQPKPRKADNEKVQFQCTVIRVAPRREITHNGKRMAEFAVTGEMPDGTHRDVFGYAPIGDDGNWTSDRYTIADAAIGKRVAVFATVNKHGQYVLDVIDNIAEV